MLSCERTRKLRDRYALEPSERPLNSSLASHGGHPGIAIGAPLENIPGRIRHDAVSGIVYLDESGKDWLTIGKEPI